MENSPFDYTDAEINQASEAGRLLSIEIEFSRICNYRCPYCYVGEPDTSDEMSSEEIAAVIQQAARLGARKVVILGGEPLLYPQLEEQLKLIESLGMRSEVFTNGALLDETMAALLARYRSRVVVKLNSLKPEIQSKLSGVPNALADALRALDHLEHAGVTGELLAASSVISRDNIDGIVELWKYLRQRGIRPYFEMITPQGRLLENQDLLIDAAKMEKIFAEIAAYDAGLGIDWVPQPPLVGGKCLRHLYSCLVAANGDVMPCVGITARIGNVRRTPLRELLENSIMLRNLKDYRQRIKEPCRNCELAESCYGCRGAAYQLTGDYLASDPMCWRNAGRLAEITFLPCSAKKLVPHGEPMVMIDELILSGEEFLVTGMVPPDHPLLTADGRLERSALIEMVAQGAAAVDTFRHGGRAAQGMLGGGSGIEIFDSVAAGEKVEIGITETAIVNEWHMVTFRIKRPGTGEKIARGELKLCVFH